MPTAATSKTIKTPSAPLGTIDPIVALALNGLSLPKHVREQVQPGTYTVSTHLHLIAEVTVLADTEAVQANKIDPWTLLALAMADLPAARIEDLVDQASALLVRKAAGEDTGTLGDEAIDQLKDKAQAAIDRIKGETKAPRKGAVSVKAILVKKG